MADEQQMASGAPTQDQYRYGSRFAIIALVAFVGVHLGIWAADWFLYMLGIPNYISPFGQLFVEPGAMLFAVFAALIHTRWMVV